MILSQLAAKSVGCQVSWLPSQLAAKSVGCQVSWLPSQLAAKSMAFVHWLNRCDHQKVHALICTQNELWREYNLYPLVEVKSLDIVISPSHTLTFTLTPSPSPLKKAEYDFYFVLNIRFFFLLFLFCFHILDEYMK
jgi:hypothetical protein